MLQTLDIKDFVIVEHLELDLHAGFTVLTGETGAGKSILLDALSLTMGERADISQIREGCTRAEIVAIFSIQPETQITLNPWLDANGFELIDSGSTLQLKRIIDNSGRTKAFINASIATLSQLKEVGEQLVDIHGQHQHQALLKSGAQRELLDRHANLNEKLAAVSNAYKEWQQVIKKVKQAQAAGNESKSQRERLEWQLEEFKELSPLPGEWADIQKEHAVLSNAAELIEGSQNLLNLLNENDNSILNQINEANHLVGQLLKIDDTFKLVSEVLEPAAIQVNEAVHTINKYFNKLDLDPERLEYLDQRLQSYYRLAKKFHCQPEELPSHWEELKSQMEAVEASQNIDQLIKTQENAKQNYFTKAHILSKNRHEAANKLSKAVSLSMQNLAMQGGQFEIELKPLDEGNQFGIETVEFLVSGHPGAKPRPVAKVASGGELARISLAIAVIASSASLIPTLIFDEVDAGIGGSVAQTVGNLLKQLGQSHQVLCVTHLPQVASQGNHHWRVKKTSTKNSTISEIEILDRTQRVEEIARMLGGSTITDTTLRHARELLSS
jgi:DNA repair protein RecN (Recombination protein N)